MPRKVKIAAVFNQTKKSGGGFNECITNACRLKKIKQSEVEIIYIVEKGADYKQLDSMDIDYLIFNFSFVSKIKTYLSRLFFKKSPLKISRLICSPFEKFVEKHHIDLVYFLSPNSWAQDLKNINYIYTLWDNCHRDELEFPEVRNNGEFEQREFLNRAVLTKAASVIVDSPATKKDLVFRYGVDDNRICIIPFKPSPFIIKPSEEFCKKTLKKYDLENKSYVFYPAQYWAHKNHVFILDALGIRKAESPNEQAIKAVFCGADKGNLEMLKGYARKKQLSDDVLFLNFLTDEEVSVLYYKCLALTMPTYFGPSNLPPLEAFKLKAPVIYPDKPEFKEFLGDACLTVNLREPRSLSEIIKKLLKNPRLVQSLQKNGSIKLSELEKVDDVWLLNEQISNFISKYRCWHG